MKFHPQEVSCTTQSLIYIVLCPSVFGVMVNHQCVLYVGWSRYTEIIVKVIIEHIKINTKNT